MSAYAILGATGNIGSSILSLLTTNHSEAKVNILIRSTSKLLSINSDFASNPNISISEGSISDSSALKKCLNDVHTVFLAVAVTDNIPGTTIAQDTAKAVVDILQDFRAKDATYKAPHLVVLSSASVADQFWKGIPQFVHNTLFCGMYYVYTDLILAETYLRQYENWLTSTFVVPGGMTHDVQRGHKLSLENQQTFISFVDVAAGMIEVADEESGRWHGRQVSVVAKDNVGKAKFAWEAPWLIGKGLIFYFFPWTYNIFL